MIVDSHVHIWRPDLVPAELRRTWAIYAANRSFPATNPDTIFPKVTAGIADPEGRYLREAMTIAGVDSAIVVGVDFAIRAGAEAPHTTLQAIHEYSALAESDPALSFVAGIDPRRPDAVTVAIGAIEKFQAVGLKLYPPAGVELDSPEALAVCRVAAERNAAVLVHTGTGPPGLDSKLAWPGNVVAVQQRFPSLKLILCHAGYPAWFEDAIAIASTHPRTFVDLSRWQHVAFSNWPQFRDMMKWAVSMLSAERFLFATDVSCGKNNYRQRAADISKWIDVVASLVGAGVLSTEQLDLILWRNAKLAFTENICATSNRSRE